MFLVDPANPHQQYLREDAETAAAKSNLKVEIVFLSGAGKLDVAHQVAQIESYLDSTAQGRPDAIVFHPVGGEGYEQVARDIAKAGLGCIVLNRMPGFLDALRRKFSGLPICAIGPDQTEIGHIQGQQFRALLPRGGFLLYVRGATVAPSAEQRLSGMMAQIKDASVETAVVCGDWVPDAAEAAITAWFCDPQNQKRSVNLVGCQNDAMAIGARRVLDRMAAELSRPDLQRVPITGCDGVPGHGLKMVADGQLAATVVVPPPTGMAVELLARFFESGALPLPQIKLPSRSLPDRQKLAATRAGA